MLFLILESDISCPGSGTHATRKWIELARIMKQWMDRTYFRYFWHFSWQMRLNPHFFMFMQCSMLREFIRRAIWRDSVCIFAWNGCLFTNNAHFSQNGEFINMVSLIKKNFNGTYLEFDTFEDIQLTTRYCQKFGIFEIFDFDSRSS